MTDEIEYKDIPVEFDGKNLTPTEDEFWRAAYVAALRSGNTGSKSCGIADRAIVRRRSRVYESPYR